MLAVNKLCALGLVFVLERGMGKEKEKQRGGAWGMLLVSRSSGGRTLSCW